MVWLGGLGPGGLDIWDPLKMKGIVAKGNPKPPGPKPPINHWLIVLQCVGFLCFTH